MDSKKTRETPKQLVKENEQLKQQLTERNDKYLRALADYQNLEKKTLEEKNEMRKYAVAQVLIRLLPFLDNLERAHVFVKDEGLRVIKEKFVLTLKEIGLEEIPVLGQEFDPRVAEAVELVKGEKDNIVVEVMRKGYILSGKVLQVAQVKVSKTH